MGEIFLARQAIAGVNRLVVLKRLLPELAEQSELLAMFVDEARIAANLAHPGIVQVHEFGEDDLGHFIVMEYVAGHHLGRLVTRSVRDHRPLAPQLGAFIGHEVARALDHAHHARDSEGIPLEIIHRDISPSNVLVSFAGDVKLMDFGIARSSNRAHRTQDGSIRGKFAYMPPEQIEGAATLDARADVWSICVVLWEITLGRRLFDGRSDLETIRATLEQPIARPTAIDATYPPALEEIVMAGLERDRTCRLPSAAALAAGLKAFLRTHPADRDDLARTMTELFPDDAVASHRLVDEETRPGLPPVPPTIIIEPMLATPPPPSRSRRVGILAVVLLLMAVGGVAIVIGSRRTVAPADSTFVDAALASGLALDVMVDATDPTPVAFADAAVVEAARDGAPVVRSRPDARRAVSPDAAAAGRPDPEPVGTPALVTVRLGQARGDQTSITFIHPAAKTCTTALATLPTRCPLSVGSQVLRFRVAGADDIVKTIELTPSGLACVVDAARRSVDCSTP